MNRLAIFLFQATAPNRAERLSLPLTLDLHSRSFLTGYFFRPLRFPPAQVVPSTESESDKRQDGEEDQEIESQDQSLSAVGAEPVAVDHADHERGERPTTPEHTSGNRVQPVRGILVPNLPPSEIPKVRPEPNAGEQGEHNHDPWTDGPVPPRDGDEHGDGKRGDDEVSHAFARLHRLDSAPRPARFGGRIGEGGECSSL